MSHKALTSDQEVRGHSGGSHTAWLYHTRPSDCYNPERWCCDHEQAVCYRADMTAAGAKATAGEKWVKTFLCLQKGTVSNSRERRLMFTSLLKSYLINSFITIHYCVCYHIKSFVPKYELNKQKDWRHENKAHYDLLWELCLIWTQISYGTNNCVFEGLTYFLYLFPPEMSYIVFNIETSQLHQTNPEQSHILLSRKYILIKWVLTMKM